MAGASAPKVMSISQAIRELGDQRRSPRFNETRRPFGKLPDTLLEIDVPLRFGEALAHKCKIAEIEKLDSFQASQCFSFDAAIQQDRDDATFGKKFVAH